MSQAPPTTESTVKGFSSFYNLSKKMSELSLGFQKQEFRTPILQKVGVPLERVGVPSRKVGVPQIHAFLSVW